MVHIVASLHSKRLPDDENASRLKIPIKRVHVSFPSCEMGYSAGAVSLSREDTASRVLASFPRNDFIGASTNATTMRRAGKHLQTGRIHNLRRNFRRSQQTVLPSSPTGGILAQQWGRSQASGRFKESGTIRSTRLLLTQLTIPLSNSALRSHPSSPGSGILQLVSSARLWQLL